MTADFDQEHTAVAQRQAQEGESLADILQQLGDRILPSLIGGTHRERLLECARTIPAAAVAYPFGFELPMHDHRLRGDLGIMLIAGTELARFFDHRGRGTQATSASAGLSELIREMECKSSRLHRLASMLMLEYDIPDSQQAAQQEPGVFLYPQESIVGGADAAHSLALMLDAIVAAAGWRSQPRQHRELARIYRELGSTARIGSFGVFPSRERDVRIAFADFRNSTEVAEFLRSIGWTAQRLSVVESLIEVFEACNSFVSILVHIDLTSDGAGPTLGLSFSLKQHPMNHPRYWIDDPQAWTRFFDCLRDEDFGVSEKLSGLRQWPSNAELLLSQSGAQIFSRGIHHFKFVLRENRIDEAKAYVSCLLLSPS